MLPPRRQGGYAHNSERAFISPATFAREEPASEAGIGVQVFETDFPDGRAGTQRMQHWSSWSKGDNGSVRYPLFTS